MKKLILLFVTALMLGVLVKVPVAVFIKDGRLGPVLVYGAEGTIWSGRASLIRVGENDIATPSWSINPLYLLIGRAQAHLDFGYLDGRGLGDVSVSLGQNVHLSDFEFTVEADQLTQQFANGFVGLEGELNVQIDSLDYQVGDIFVKNTSGYVGWQKAGVAYPLSGGFGNISVDISQDEESDLLQAEVSNQGGELSVDGTASLGASMAYSVDTLLKPNASITEALADTLAAAMPKNTDGTFHFKRNGALDQLR